MRRYVSLGIGIWAAATIALRLFGQFVFRDASPRTGALLVAASLPLMLALAALLLPRDETRPRAAIALALPGMLLDTISALAFASVFPNIRADAAGLFGGWLLFCNAVMLLAGVVHRRPQLLAEHGAVHAFYGGRRHSMPDERSDVDDAELARLKDQEGGR